jgi:flagellar hook-basal body complex protein FliE
MKVGFNAAAAAYANTLRRAAPAAAEVGGAGGGAFGEMVKQAASSTLGSIKAGEAATLQAITGKPDMTQVVTAVSNAEVTLQAAVAVRDKVIQAYLDVIRMPI